MTRKQAIEVIAANMVRENAGEFTKAQARKMLGAWYSDAELVRTAAAIEADARKAATR